MLKFITKVLLFSLFSLGLYAGDGLSQEHLVSVSPEALATDISADTIIEVVFDTPIVVASVKKNTIKLKNIKGTTTLVGENTLRFTPNEALESGDYDVVVKKVKLQNTQSGNTELKPKNGYEKFIYWLCSIFYDNPADCPLCKKVCGNSSDSIKTKKIKYIFTVDDASPKIETITFSETSIELHEGNETTLTVTAKYDDNTTQDISNDVEWVIQDSSIVSIANGTFKALKEGTTTIQAKYEGKTSDTLTVAVYKEINGYRLPPEPDETLNNSTLLGIDVNDNGVRDDVERWIYQNYEHPIEIGIFMQSSRAYGMVIVDPSKALETKKYSDNAVSCLFYWFRKENSPLDRFKNYDDSKKLKKIQFNTLKRHINYDKYQKTLSGGVYNLLPKSKEKCEFDDSGILGDLK